MSIIFLLLSVVLCDKVNELSVEAPLTNTDNEVGQTFEEVIGKYEVGNERRRLKRVCKVQFEHCKLYRKKNNPTVYLYLNGQCRHVHDPSTYFRLFKSWRSVNWVPDNEWPQCFTGQRLQGAFLGRARGRNGVYLFTNGVKMLIKSRNAFNRCGFNWRKVVSLPSSYVARTRTGSDIN